MLKPDLPIIIIQDADQHPISTTQDVLCQIELDKYSIQLKGIDLDQFMQMTEEKDFEQYGVRKQRDCQKLSSTAKSIRRSSIGTSSSYTTSEDEQEEQEENDISLQQNGNAAWPNSIYGFTKSAQSRRYSLPIYSDVSTEADMGRRHSFHSTGILSQQEDLLPSYSCTLHKLGKAKAKIEFEYPGKRKRRRPWRDIYIELKGTMLRLYEMKSNDAYHYLPTLTAYYQQSVEYTPLIDLSLAYAKVDQAQDYKKRPNVFRVQTAFGPQVLFQVQTNAAVSLWVEKILAGCMIAIGFA
ncbi:Pleckstrin homology domain-containing protein [Blakeslea trispora]|nr:Pleckstrin homology domain-containing protein [Blakeslea trispora]